MNARGAPSTPPVRTSGRSPGPPRAGQTLTRFLAAAASTVDLESRTVELSFSSETPVKRWFGDEVLSHAPDAADLSRLNAGAPLLFNHNQDDVLGVVESASIGADRKGRAVVRFGQDERGQWAMAQIADGILSNVSIAYIVNEYSSAELDAPADASPWVASRWTALEISIVTIPADLSVGVGRSLNITQSPIMEHQQETNSLSRRQRAAVNQAETLESERERTREIGAICRRYGIPAEQADQMITDGTSVAEARGLAMARVLSRGQQSPAASGAGLPGHLGLSDREAQSFSLVRAIHATVTGDWSEAGFERECSRTVEQQIGRAPAARAFFVPLDVQQRTPWLGDQQVRSPYLVGTPSQGGNLVATNLLGDQFVEALRNTSQVLSAGATVLSGLVGNVDIPRRITTTGTTWVTESQALTESEATFDKVSLRPKTIGAYSKMSRNMLLQSTPSIELLARADLMAQIALGIDLAALSGPGTGGAPLGVANTSGIGAVLGGANGAQITLDHVIQLDAALSNSNAPFDSRSYIFNSKTISWLKGLKASTGAYLWTTANNGGRSGTPPDINGHQLRMSNQARSTLTKGTSNGVCSELFFGAWSELLIGQWGVLEIVTNPYDSTGFLNGDVLIRAMQTVDVVVKHAASFATMSDGLPQ